MLDQSVYVSRDVHTIWWLQVTGKFIHAVYQGTCPASMLLTFDDGEISFDWRSRNIVNAKQPESST